MPVNNAMAEFQCGRPQKPHYGSRLSVCPLQDSALEANFNVMRYIINSRFTHSSILNRNCYYKLLVGIFVFLFYHFYCFYCFYYFTCVLWTFLFEINLIDWLIRLYVGVDQGSEIKLRIIVIDLNNFYCTAQLPSAPCCTCRSMLVKLSILHASCHKNNIFC